MNVIKKLSAILSIALIAGLGIFGVSKAINAQETQNENTKQQETKRKDKRESEERQNKKGDREENESSEKEDADEETADDDEREEADSDEQSEQAALAGQAAVSKEQAQTVALQRVAGDVLKSELEDEDGRIVYGFEIRDSNGKVFDVKVDAKTGAFVKASADDDNEEKGETSENDEQNETEND